MHEFAEGKRAYDMARIRHDQTRWSTGRYRSALEMLDQVTPRSLSDLSDRSEPSGRARTVFHDFEAHGGAHTQKQGNEQSGKNGPLFPPAQ